MSTRSEWRLALLAVLALAWLAPAAFAQAPQPKVSARLSAGVVKLGSLARLLIVVEDAEGAQILALPSVQGLELGPLGQPSSLLRRSFVNGRYSSSSELTWNVPVRPLQAGDFTIPPIEVRAGGRSLSTPALSLTAVADLRGEELGFFLATPTLTRAVEGEPFAIELRFGWDQALASTVNYANLALPWWDELPGTLTTEPAAASSLRQVQIALNTNRRITVEELDPEQVRGRPFRMFRTVRWFIPTRAGTLEFPTSFLEFGHDPVSRGRDRSDSYFVRGDSFTVEVVSLPEQGRPLAFSGAIGSLSVRADAQPRDVDAGDSIQLSVEWTGRGNLEFFRPPDPARVEGFEGFRVYGHREELKSFDRRRVVYDLAPLRPDVVEIPALPLSVYDPELSGYTTLSTQPIPIRVRALEGAAELSSAPERSRAARDVRDLRTEAASPGETPRPGTAALAALLAATPLLWLGLRTSVRRRGRPDAPLERRRRRARRELARALKGSGGAKEMLDALESWIAARRREAPQAWIGRDPAELVQAGVLDEAGARELEGLHARLERAAYGGAPLDVDRAEVLETAARLEERGL